MSKQSRRLFPYVLACFCPCSIVRSIVRRLTSQRTSLLPSPPPLSVAQAYLHTLMVSVLDEEAYRAATAGPVPGERVWTSPQINRRRAVVMLLATMAA